MPVPPDWESWALSASWLPSSAQIAAVYGLPPTSTSGAVAPEGTVASTTIVTRNCREYEALYVPELDAATGSGFGAPPGLHATKFHRVSVPTRMFASAAMVCEVPSFHHTTCGIGRPAPPSITTEAEGPPDATWMSIRNWWNQFAVTDFGASIVIVVGFALPVALPVHELNRYRSESVSVGAVPWMPSTTSWRPGGFVSRITRYCTL